MGRMQDPVIAGTTERWRRTAWWLLGLVAMSALLGAALSPHLYQALLYVGRHAVWLQKMRDLEFERVLSRAVMVFVVAGGLLTLRWSGLSGLADLGYPRRTSGWQDFLIGAAAGVFSMALLQWIGFAAGAYQWVEGWKPLLRRQIATAWFGALAVGLIEEGFFRGLLVRVFTPGRRAWPGFFATSVLFSLAHFVKPEPPFGVAHARWSTGFEVMAYAFNRLDGSWHSFPLSLNLFLMGWALCAMARVRGDVYAVAGLHAGWVWVLQSVSGLVKKDPEHWLIWFGPSADIAKGWLATIVLGVLAVAATWKVWRRERASPS